MTREIGRRLVTQLTGDELFACEHGLERYITARDLRAYCGGDAAVPVIACEQGANARRISDFPNAETAMGAGDLITGLRNGANVNYPPSLILAPLIDVMLELVAKCDRLEKVLKKHGLGEEE